MIPRRFSMLTIAAILGFATTAQIAAADPAANEREPPLRLKLRVIFVHDGAFQLLDDVDGLSAEALRKRVQLDKQVQRVFVEDPPSINGTQQLSVNVDTVALESMLGELQEMKLIESGIPVTVESDRSAYAPAHVRSLRPDAADPVWANMLWGVKRRELKEGRLGISLRSPSEPQPGDTSIYEPGYVRGIVRFVPGETAIVPWYHHWINSENRERFREHHDGEQFVLVTMDREVEDGSAEPGTGEAKKAGAKDTGSRNSKQQRKKLTAKLAQWSGAWTVADDVNRVLGYADAGKRNDASWVHPTSFRLSFDETIGKGWGKVTYEGYRDQVFKRIGHELVATGKWESKFEDDPGVGHDSFVTQDEGATYLWCDAPYVVLFGGRVSFLQGAKRDRDVLVIDFNSFHDRLAGGANTYDTVAYKRVKDKKPAADNTTGEQAPARIDAPASDGAVALSGKLPKPGKGWKKTDDGQTKGGMYSWVHFKHAESGDVLAFAATRNTASLKVEHSPIRQASIETFTHTGRASWSARSGSEPIADMIRNRIVTVSAGNATNDRKYREEAIEFSYVYEPSGDSPPNMAHGYVIVVGDLTVFVQHTSQKVITSELAADMVCGLLTKHLAEQTSIPKGWGVMIRRNKR